MGRGRAKAKQTKVARELKYSSPSMDLDRLKTDLGVAGPPSHEGDLRELDGDEDDDDPYAYDEDDEPASGR